jgi:hypothetical protein
MIEQKLIVGRYLELVTAPPTLVGVPNNGFQEVTSVVLHIEESGSVGAPVAPYNPIGNPSLREQLGFRANQAGQMIQAQFDRQRVSGTGTGAVAKAYRNFVWLEWLGGLVSEVRPNGVDVLTGPMSGCWITSYLKGANRYVGHVGTVMSAADPLSVAARNSWNAFANAQQMGSMSGFDPFNDWNGAFPAPQAGDGPMKTFALVTATNTFHTIVTFSQANKPTRIRIAGVQQINPPTLPNNGQI